MSLVLSIVTIIYEFGVLPFAAGILLGSGDEEEISIHRMYIKGYCLLFTIFLFMAVPVIFTVNKLSVLVFIWKIFLIVTLPVLFLLYYKRKKHSVCKKKIRNKHFVYDHDFYDQCNIFYAIAKG